MRIAIALVIVIIIIITINIRIILSRTIPLEHSLFHHSRQDRMTEISFS